MRGTIATLKHLYGCRPESDLLTRFAMTNSAKCSWKDDDANMVPNKLYKNCREHGLAELKELKSSTRRNSREACRGFVEIPIPRC